MEALRWTKSQLQSSRQWFRRIGALAVTALGFASSVHGAPSSPVTVAVARDCASPAPGAVQVRLMNGGLQSSPDCITWGECVLPVKTYWRAVTAGRGQVVAVGGSYFDERVAVITSRDGSTWTRRRIPTSSPLYDVTFGRDLFVAVGEAGAIFTSTDGLAWTRRSSGCNDVLLAAITFGNGRFVAGGESGCILTSTNGIHWTHIALSPSIFIGRIDFVNNCFVVRNGSQTFSSRDALRWECSAFSSSDGTGPSEMH